MSKDHWGAAGQAGDGVRWCAAARTWPLVAGEDGQIWNDRILGCRDFGWLPLDPLTENNEVPGGEGWAGRAEVKISVK